MRRSDFIGFAGRHGRCLGVCRTGAIGDARDRVSQQRDGRRFAHFVAAFLRGSTKPAMSSVETLQSNTRSVLARADEVIEWTRAAPQSTR
jgi:hypothetical protein